VIGRVFLKLKFVQTLAHLALVLDEGPQYACQQKIQLLVGVISFCAPYHSLFIQFLRKALRALRFEQNTELKSAYMSINFFEAKRASWQPLKVYPVGYFLLWLG